MVFRTGGDELAVIYVKDKSAPTEAFREEVQRLASEVAKIEYIAKNDPGDVEVPTFLRIGVGPTFKLADEAETAVRSIIYKTGELCSLPPVLSFARAGCESGRTRRTFPRD